MYSYRPAVEIRQNKASLIPMLCLLFLVLIFITYFIYFSGRFEGYQWVKKAAGFFIAFWVYAIYLPVKKLVKNQPILILSTDSLIINEAVKTIEFTWPQILDWKIKYRGSTYYLFVYTDDTIKQINISWLDKTPNEIERLIQDFQPQEVQ